MLLLKFVEEVLCCLPKTTFSVLHYLQVCPNSLLLNWWCHQTISCPWCSLLLSLTFPSFRVFSKESAVSIRWPKHYSFSISSSSEYSGLIPFKNDLWDLIAVQGTLKNLLQHCTSKTSILWCSAFLMGQLSHLYMSTGKTTWILIGKIMSLLSNGFSSFPVAPQSRSNHLLIKWLQSPSIVVLEPKKKNLSLFSPTPFLFAMEKWDWIPWSYC